MKTLMKVIAISATLVSTGVLADNFSYRCYQQQSENGKPDLILYKFNEDTEAYRKALRYLASSNGMSNKRFLNWVQERNFTGIWMIRTKDNVQIPALHTIEGLNRSWYFGDLSAETTYYNIDIDPNGNGYYYVFPTGFTGEQSPRDSFECKSTK